MPQGKKRKSADTRIAKPIEITPPNVKELLDKFGRDELVKLANQEFKGEALETFLAAMRTANNNAKPSQGSQMLLWETIMVLVSLLYPARADAAIEMNLTMRQRRSLAWSPPLCHSWRRCRTSSSPVHLNR
jgi:hypothetical protein